AITIPCGSISGLPIGLQIVGKYMQDQALLSIANAIEDILAKRG
ncbi:MAG TPA: hypothetical protein DE117_03105, partial [Fervidobacterium sp.]|nr:hypothetical protein [Fervidobacterium sp.]